MLKPVKISAHKEEYADPMSKEEVESVKESLRDIKEGRYTTIASVKELDKYFDDLQ